jgi:hypothetical protein
MPHLCSEGMYTVGMTTAGLAFLIILGLFVAFFTPDTWVGFIGWGRRKGWREPKERIEEGPRDAD